MGAAPLGFPFRVSLRVFRHNCGIRLFSHQLVLGHGVGCIGEPVEEAGLAVQVLPGSISLLLLSQEATMRNAVTFPGTEELAVLPAWGLLSAPPHRHPRRVRCLQGQCHRLSTFPPHIPEQRVESNLGAVERGRAGVLVCVRDQWYP